MYVLHGFESRILDILLRAKQVLPVSGKNFRDDSIGTMHAAAQDVKRPAEYDISGKPTAVERPQYSVFEFCGHHHDRANGARQSPNTDAQNQFQCTKTISITKMVKISRTN